MSTDTLEAGSPPLAAGAPLLVLHKLDKRFGATHALKRVDLDFTPGEIHVIVGENGAGKSTLAMIYFAYIVSATLAAFVGVLLASRIGIGNATQAEGWELQAIASSVIGGTSLFGAVGSIQGPLLGSSILSTINNGVNLLNVNPFWQRIITGGLIIVIVYFDQLRRKKR